MVPEFSIFCYFSFPLLDTAAVGGGGNDDDDEDDDGSDDDDNDLSGRSKEL